MTRSLALLLLTLTALVAACGVRPSAPIQGGPAPTEEPSGAVIIYLLNGATLTRVARPPAPDQATNLEVLAAGPTAEERAQGLTTEIPPYAAPAATPTSGGVTVRVETPVKYLSRLAQAQLVCTAAPVDGESPVPVTLTDETETLPPRTCPFKP